MHWFNEFIVFNLVSYTSSMNLLWSHISDETTWVLSCFKYIQHRIEPIRKHRRLEERESGVGVSDSSGFLQQTPPVHIYYLLFCFIQNFLLNFIWATFEWEAPQVQTPKRAWDKFWWDNILGTTEWVSQSEIFFQLGTAIKQAKQTNQSGFFIEKEKRKR